MHQFELNGYKIVVDEHSGSVHSVDALAYAMIGDYGRLLKLCRDPEAEADRAARVAAEAKRAAERAESRARAEAEGKLWKGGCGCSGGCACKGQASAQGAAAVKAEALKAESPSTAAVPAAESEAPVHYEYEVEAGGFLPEVLRERLVQETLAKFPNEAEADVRDCLEDILELQRSGKLFSKDPFRKLALNLEKRSMVVKALCLHVAHTCNLNCSYCFASQGKYHGERALMSEKVGYRAIDFLLENSGSRRNLEVDFFGGEPLMNWDVCKKIVAYARSKEKEYNKKFRFTLTTNGVAVNDDVIDFANAEMDNVVLSLDGRKEVHDHLRKDYHGRGSWETIVPKFQEFVKRRKGRKYYMRGTYTHFNTDFMNDIQVMLDLGFRELSLEPVVCPPSDPYALTEEDLPILYEQYERLAKKMLEQDEAGDPFGFYHYILDLGHGPCIYKRIAGCGSGTEYFAVTPWGELYPCHQFVGDPAYSMGDIWTGVKNLEKQREFCSCNVYAHKECDDCWARLYCSGGCSANNYHASGSIEGVYDYGCKLFKKRMECALMVAVDRTSRQMLEEGLTEGVSAELLGGGAAEPEVEAPRHEAEQAPVDTDALVAACGSDAACSSCMAELLEAMAVDVQK